VGNLVKSVISGKSNYLLGKQFQKKVHDTNTTIKKYYSSGSVQIALRTITEIPLPWERVRVRSSFPGGW
jgi:hypothetical protein